MNTRIGLLMGLLAVQIVLAAVLMLRTPDAAPGGGALLDVDAEAVATLRIADDEGAAVALTRDGDGWRLAEAGLPADGDKAGAIVDKLLGLRAPWPVATTGGSAQRFEVTDDDHQRRIELLDDGQQSLAVLFLGTSPGYGRVHGRLQGSDDVYALNLSNYEVPAALDDWLDRSLLAAEGDLDSVTGAAGWQLQRGDEGWLLDGAAADGDAVQPVLDRLSGLRVLGVFETTDENLDDRGRVRYLDEAGEHLIDFAFDTDEDQYVVTSSRVDGRFKVASYIAEQILVEAQALRVSDEADAED